MSSPAPSRRVVLRGALLLPAVALPACTADDAASPARPRPPDRDRTLHAAAVRRERGLVQAYDDAVAATPELAERLSPLRAEHAQHLAALEGLTATPTPAPDDEEPAPAPTAAPPVPPAPPAETLARLGQAERTAATAHAQGALLASRRLAPLLAELAASEASHPVALQ